MPTKLTTGNYKCLHCNQVISSHRKAKNHEETCNIDRLGKHLGDKLGNVVELDINGFDTKPSRQLKIGESFVGRCGNCKNVLTTENRFEKESKLFECPKCENVISK